EYKPEAECPEFEKFLASVVPNDVIDMVWELIGYMMYSGNPLHKAVMFHGMGRNGKGTLIRAIQGVIGKKNTTAVTLQALTEERFAPAALFGKLANIAGDIDGTYMDKTARFKAITGLDEIHAEFKGKDGFDFTPFAVPLFSANKIPGSADVTSGYLGRWVVVPFPHNFTGREDRGLDDRIANELEGIAAKAIPALQRLMARQNFDEPESAKEAMNDFKRKVDQVRTWAEDCAELDTEAGHVGRSELYAHYKEWAKDGGIGQLKNSEFFDRVEALGCVQAKIKGIRGFKGIRIIALPTGEPLAEERSPFQD
ncbi:MAG TPA: phage/plasmid primase, P4 family, partial [Acidimicrobiia bacterium]|nr:phage/plasmid primase, P4 family [Acidimicrobiia bacterium]